MNGPSRKRFEEIYSTGLRASGKSLRVHALPGTGLVGFAVARDIGCHARRNRQRRRVQSAARLACLPATMDLVIGVRASVRDASPSEIREELGRLVKELESRWADGSVCS